MLSEPGTEKIIQSAGYSVIGSFRLPDAGWWDQYYSPLTDRMDMLKGKYANNPDAQSIIQGLEREMEIHRKYSKEYGYSFFICTSSVPDISDKNEQ